MYKSSQSNYKPCTHTGIQSPILPLPHPMNHMWSSTRWSHPFVSQTQLMLCIIITMYSVFLFFPLLCQPFWKKWWKIWWMWAAKSKLELVGASGICGGNDIISNHMPWHQSEPCFWIRSFYSALVFRCGRPCLRSTATDGMYHQKPKERRVGELLQKDDRIGELWSTRVKNRNETYT